MPRIVAKQLSRPWRVFVVSLILLGVCAGPALAASTLPPAPFVATGAAASISETGVLLQAQVNPNGSALSDCHFDYGVSTSYGLSAPCAFTQSGSLNLQSVYAQLTGLPPGTLYHFRVAATNEGGTSTGEDGFFSTLQRPLPVPVTPPPPPVVTPTGPSVPVRPPVYTRPPAYQEPEEGSRYRRRTYHPQNPNDVGLFVHYCPESAQASSTRVLSARVSEVGWPSPTAKIAGTSEAGWPPHECLKMDKGPAGQHHTIVGMKGVHNWLLGGYGNNTIIGGDRGDVIWADYQPTGEPKFQTATIRGGNGRNFIYANDTVNTVWTGTNPKTVVHAHATGIRGVIHCQSSGIVVFLSSISEKHFKLIGCRHISHYSVGY